MRFLKQLSTVVTVAAVLALSFGVMGCAEEPSAPDAADINTESDLGQPESGSQL